MKVVLPIPLSPTTIKRSDRFCHDRPHFGTERRASSMSSFRFAVETLHSSAGMAIGRMAFGSLHSISIAWNRFISFKSFRKPSHMRMPLIAGQRFRSVGFRSTPSVRLSTPHVPKRNRKALTARKCCSHLRLATALLARTQAPALTRSIGCICHSHGASRGHSSMHSMVYSKYSHKVP